MVVDFHVHLENTPDGHLITPDELVESMDRNGIDACVLLGNDQADAGSMPPWSDPRMIAVPVNLTDELLSQYSSKYPDRLISFTSVNPDRFQPERKVSRAVEEFGARGVKLYPHSGFYPNDPRLFSVYEKCIQYDIPVMIHSGIKPVRWQSLKYNDPVYVDDIALKYPDLKIILCHGGYPWTENYMAVVHSNPNIYADLTFLEYIEETYMVPGLTENTVRRLQKLIGTKRMVWGTEGPFMELPAFGSHCEEHYAKCKDFLVERFDFLSREEKDDILGNTACKLLKL